MQAAHKTQLQNHRTNSRAVAAAQAHPSAPTRTAATTPDCRSSPSSSEVYPSCTRTRCRVSEIRARNMEGTARAGCECTGTRLTAKGCAAGPAQGWARNSVVRGRLSATRTRPLLSWAIGHAHCCRMVEPGAVSSSCSWLRLRLVPSVAGGSYKHCTGVEVRPSN